MAHAAVVLKRTKAAFGVCLCTFVLKLVQRGPARQRHFRVNNREN
jgi:hypothetical protein